MTSLLTPPIIAIAAKAVRRISYESPELITRLKRGVRGGQNLTDRHLRLEKSLRGKEARSKQTNDLPNFSTVVHSPSILQRPTLTFRGFVVPEEPRPPEPDECCMSGCAICVHDLYQDSLATYHESVASLRSSLAGLDIPESEWPSNIQTSAVGSAARKDVVMDVFAEMERNLRQKRQANADNFSAQSQSNTTEQPQGRVAFDMREIYEGLRWVLFSKR